MNRPSSADGALPGIIGSLVSIIPLIVAFLTLQKYWQGGLSVGSLK